MTKRRIPLCKKLSPIGMAAFAGILFCVVSACADEMIYCNDFSMRESSQPIPEYGVVHEAQPYPTVFSDIAFTPSSLTGDYVANDARFSLRGTYYAGTVGSGNDRPNYDGWVTPFHILRTKYKAHPSIQKDDGNPVFSWYGNNAKDSRNGFVMQSIHNAFTSGVLRVQVDMRPPATWTTPPEESKYHSCRVFPVYGKYMDPLALGGDGENCLFVASPCPNITPGSIGVTSGKSSHSVRKVFIRGYYYDDAKRWLANQNLGSSFDIADDASNLKWVRIVATYDLDQSKFSATSYIFGDSAHPTLETATPSTSYAEFSENDILRIDGIDGAVAGIGIMGSGIFGTSITTDTKAMVDNLRLSWKAPGADDFEVFYENDFSNRWYKTVCAVNRSTSSAYAPTTVLTNVVDSSTATLAALKSTDAKGFSTNSLVPAVSSSPSAAQPVGYDGWRRLPVANDASASFTAFKVVESQYDRIGESSESYVYGTGGNYAAFGSPNAQCSHAIVVHPIGETYTDGKVRLSVDMRLPLLTEPTEFVADIMRAAVGFGSAALYSSPRESLAGNIVAGCGYVRTRNGSTTNHVPYVMAPSSVSGREYAVESTFTEPADNYWHRMEVSVDLGARTYGVTVTPLSAISSSADFAPTNAPIYEKAGLPLASDAADVGAIYLRGFGYRPSMSLQFLKGRVCFDNIRIWRQAPGVVTETLAYSNDFKDRVRIPTGSPTAYARAVGYVADVFDQDDGPDHWIRRSVAGDEGYWATATVRDDGGNQFLALGAEMEAGRRVQVSHAFGESLKCPFSFSVDVRPPSGWRVKGGFVLISLGGAQMEQTEAAESIFNAHRQISFGFTDADGNPECPWVRPYMQPIVRTIENGVETDKPLCATSAISNGHWYRFKVRMMPDDGVCNVRLYDMGTAHPAFSGASGTIVAAVDNVPFLNGLAPDKGVCAFNIHAYGMGGALGTDGVDADNVMIDNIAVKKILGTMLILR